jgi:hypothetical protein
VSLENGLGMLQFDHAVFSIWAAGFGFLALLWAILDRVKEEGWDIGCMCISLACASVFWGTPNSSRVEYAWFVGGIINTSPPWILDLHSFQCFIRSSNNCTTPSHKWLGFDQRGNISLLALLQHVIHTAITSKAKR